jgi:hypothetical protein
MQTCFWKFFIASALITFSVSARATDAAFIGAPHIDTGDSWVFDATHERGRNGFLKQRIDLIIERVSSDTMIVGAKLDGAPSDFVDHITGLDWSQKRVLDGKETRTGHPFAFPLAIGKTWSLDYTDDRGRGILESAHFHNVYKVVGWEDVTVPAGKFRAIKIEMNGTIEAHTGATSSVGEASAATGAGVTSVMRTQSLGPQTLDLLTYGEFYYVPSIKYWVKSLEEQYNSDNVRVRRDVQELVSFKHPS